jgi:uncharacterized protein (DUF1778 family)
VLRNYVLALDQFEFRIEKEQGQGNSGVMRGVHKTTEKILKARERILLSAAESRRFVKALFALPRPPTPDMREAMREYRATVKSDLD